MSDAAMPGGFSEYTCKISPEAQKSFDEATRDIIGVTYTTVAVSQQVVAGLNYRFFCNARNATMYPPNGAAIVSVYQPLDGPAHVTGIQRIS